MKSFGLTLRKGRLLQCIASKEAAYKMGISHCYLSRIENGLEPATINLIKSALRNGFITKHEFQDFLEEICERKCRNIP